MKIVLWIIQVVLAAMFVMAGSAKFMMTEEALTAAYKLPLLFIQFIGVCELLGAVGLILPSLLRIRPMLTPLAAAGLAIITLGATVVTLVIGGGIMALYPFIIALLCLFVVWGRTRIAPIAEKSEAGALQLNR